MFSYLGVGMVLNEEKRARLANALARRQGAPGAAGALAPSAPAPAPSAPIAAVPLAIVHASPTPAPLEKDKGVVEIKSDEDEETAEGPIFKR